MSSTRASRLTSTRMVTTTANDASRALREAAFEITSVPR